MKDEHDDILNTTISRKEFIKKAAASTAALAALLALSPEAAAEAATVQITDNITAGVSIGPAAPANVRTLWVDTSDYGILKFNNGTTWTPAAAGKATTLQTGRNIQVDLGSELPEEFDGSADIAPGVTGTLPIAHGGTGLTSSPAMAVNLASTSTDNVLKAAPRPGVTGTLPVANGGTGAATHTANAVLTGNGTNPVQEVATADGAMFATQAGGAAQFGTLPVAQGGTGAVNAATARANLGVAAGNIPMTDYEMAATAADIEETDSVNTAIGKLEKKISETGTAATTHGHGNITNDGKVGTAADMALITGTGGLVQAANLTTASPSTTNATTTEFIDTISQDSKGKITATKRKLPASTAAPGNISPSAGAAGSSTNYARQDHTHKIDLATGDSNGQVKIAGSNVAVKGLGTAAYTTFGTIPVNPTNTSGLNIWIET